MVRYSYIAAIAAVSTFYLPVTTHAFTSVDLPTKLSIPTTSRLTSPKHTSYNDSNSDHLSKSRLMAFYSSSNSSNNVQGNEDGIIEPTIIEKKMAHNYDMNRRKNIQGLHPFIHKSWKNISQKIQAPFGGITKHKALSLLTAFVILISVTFAPVQDAFAAPSGGRMGGSFGGSSRSRSPSTTRSYSSPSRSYSSPSRGYSRGYYSRPNVIVAPTIGSPMYPTYGYGAGGVAVVRRGPSIVDVFVLGFFAFVMFNIFSSSGGEGGAGGGLLDRSMDDTMSALGPGVSVAQISVALNVPQKDSPSSILSFLERLSRTARTDSRVGISNLVSQVSIELLRQKKSAFAAGTKYTHYRDAAKAERDFNSLAIKERSKFEKENINKYGGVDYSPKSPSSSGDSFSPQATAAVVTIVLSIDGDSTKLPTINSVSDLETALLRIASDVKLDGCLRSAEILWTPEDSDDTLSEKDVTADYPELRII